MHKDAKLIQFVALIAIGATLALSLVFYVYGLPIVRGDVQAWTGLLILVFLATTGEGLAIRFQSGKAAMSVASIPIVALVPLYGPAVATAGTAISEILGQFALNRKRKRVKQLFNIAQSVLAIAFASAVYKLLGGPVSTTSFDLTAIALPMVGLILSYFVTNTSLVSVVIALDAGRKVLDTLRAVSPTTFANDIASSSFSLLLVFAFAEMGFVGLLFLLLPLLFVHHSYRVYLTLLKQNNEILELLVKTIEAKDPYTSGHSQRVATLSREIAVDMGLPHSMVEKVETSALLHDIGKIDVAFAGVIRSSHQLSPEERHIIRSHPVRGAKLLASISSLGDHVLKAVRHHHEHYDGNGYPDGLSGKDIPLGARIIMVADTVDAMLSDRPYRPALTEGQVEDELNRFSGRQFDPQIVRVFRQSNLAQKAAARAAADRTAIPGTPALPKSNAAFHG